MPIPQVGERQETIIKLERDTALLLGRQEAIAITINAITNSQKRFFFHVGLSDERSSRAAMLPNDDLDLRYCKTGLWFKRWIDRLEGKMATQLTAIVTTLITGVLAFSSPSLAASDAELASLGNKMSGAFKCSIYASMFQDWKEQQRLFQIGLNAGRDFVEGMKSRTDPNPSVGGMLAFVRGVSTDFMVGSMYDSETTKALDEIPVEQRVDPAEEKTQAENIYRESNCSSIQ